MMVQLPHSLILFACFAMLPVGRANSSQAASQMVSFESLNNDPEFTMASVDPQPLEISVEKHVTSTTDSNSGSEAPQNIVQTLEGSPSGIAALDPSPVHSHGSSAAPVSAPEEKGGPKPEGLVKADERPQAGAARTITSTRTSTHTIPVTPTVAPEEITTIVIHTVHTLTVTPTPTSPPFPVIVNTVSSIVTSTETTIATPRPSRDPVNVMSSNDPTTTAAVFFPVTSSEATPAQAGQDPQKDMPIEANGAIRDSITLKDLQRMFQEQLQKFREEFEPSQTSYTSVPTPSASPDQVPHVDPPVTSIPQRKSGDMNFGVGQPVQETELDKIISEVLPDVDIETKNSVRKVLNSILKNDDTKIQKSVPNETPEVNRPQSPELIEDPPYPQEKALPWMRPSSSSSSRSSPAANSEGSEQFITAGLTDKDQSQVEKYFSLLNLGRLKGLPEDAVHDLLDFLRADDKHQFVDDFRQRPFLKKIGLDVTSAPEIATPASSDHTSTLLPDAGVSEIDKAASDITDFDTLEQQVDQYLSEHPNDLEHGDESYDTDDKNLENLEQSIDEIKQDENDEVVESTGVLKNGLRRVSKLKNDQTPTKLTENAGTSKSTELTKGSDDKDYKPLDGSRFTSKFGKKPKLKKISAEGDEEEIELYDPEDDLFPKPEGSKTASTLTKSGEVMSNNHNNEDERSRDQKKKKKKVQSLNDDIADTTFGSQSTNSTAASEKSNSTESTNSSLGSPGSPHDKFADIMKTTETKSEDQKSKTTNSLELYLDKVKKNPSSLFPKNDATLNQKSTYGDDDGGDLAIPKEKYKGSKKSGNSDFFGFSNGASASSMNLFLSKDIVSTLIVVLAVCVILV